MRQFMTGADFCIVYLILALNLILNLLADSTDAEMAAAAAARIGPTVVMNTYTHTHVNPQYYQVRYEWRMLNLHSHKVHTSSQGI